MIYYKDQRIDSKRTSLKDFYRFIDYLSLIGVAYKGNSSTIREGYVVSNAWYKDHTYVGDWYVDEETIPYIKEYNRIFKNEES